MLDLIRGTGLVELVAGCRLTVDRTLRITDLYSRDEIDSLLLNVVRTNTTSEQDTGSSAGTENVLAKFAGDGSLLDSLMSESGSIVTVDGSLTINTIGSGSGNAVVTQESGLLKTRTIDSRAWSGGGLVDGSGTATYIPLWQDSNTLTNSIMVQNDSKIGIGVADADTLLEVYGSSAQLKLSFDGTYNTTLATGSTGNLTITPSGSHAYFNAYLGATDFRKTGWPLSPGVTLSFNDGTLTLTVTDGGSAYYYINGVKYTLGGNKTATITDTEGMWYFYFSGSTLTASQTPWVITDDDKALVAYLYWDATNNKSIGTGYELHGWTMDAATHARLHECEGAAWESGFAITNNGDQTINMTAGSLHDEDIEIAVTDGSGSSLFEQQLTPAEIPIYYQSGASSWRIYETTDKAAVTDIGYVNSTVLYYNKYTTSWAPASVDVGKYVAMWIIGTNELSDPIISIMGQRVDTTLAAAKENNTFGSLSFGAMPVQEFIIIARIIIKATATGKYYTIEDITDLRTANTTGSASNVLTSDHGGLGGLADDDHAQYLLLAGRSGGQHAYGSNVASENLTLESTSNGTKGYVLIQPNGGSLGLGVSDPDSMFEIKGSGATHLVNINNTTAGKAGIKLSSGDDIVGGFGLSGLYKGTSATDVVLIAQTGSSLLFCTNGSATEKVIIDTNGYMGIGVSDPSSKLEIRDGLIYLSDADVGHGMTSVVQTDVYGTLGILDATKGGVQLIGLSDDDFYSASLLGIRGGTSSNYSAVVLTGCLKSDTSYGAMGSSDKVLQIDNYTTNLITVLGNGSVGIGTPSTAAKLHIHSSANDSAVLLSADGANSYPNIRFTNDAQSWTVYGADGSQSDMFVVYNTTTPGNAIAITPSTNFVSLGGGYFDSVRLQLYGSNAGAALAMTNTAAGAHSFYITPYIVGVANAGFDIYDSTDARHAFTIDDSGYIGINTPTPARYLHVHGVDGADGNEFSSLIVSCASDSTKHINLAYDYANDAGAISSVDQGTGWKNTYIPYANFGIGVSDPQAKFEIKDGAIFLSDSDIAHGVTTLFHTDTYGYFGVANASYGGLKIIGATDTEYDTTAIWLLGVKTYTCGGSLYPAINLDAAYASGTGLTSLPTSDTAFGISNNGTRLVTVMGSGNMGVGVSPTYKLDVADGLIAFYDTDLSHGITSQMAAHYYGSIGIVDATYGGLGIRGISNGSYTAIRMFAMVGSSDPTDSVPAFDLDAYKQSGTGVQALGASETVFQLKNSSTILVTVLGSGYVGINDTTPSTWLDVNSGTEDLIAQFISTDDLAYIKISDNDTSNYLVCKDGYFSLGANATLHAGNLNINNSNGYVGIGTISPSSQFNVHALDNGVISFDSPLTGVGNYIGLRFGSSYPIYKSAIYHYRTGDYAIGQMRFCIDNTGDTSDVDVGDIALVIDSTKLIGIGTASPHYGISFGDSSPDRIIGYYSDATHYAYMQLYNGSTGGIVFDHYTGSSGGYQWQYATSPLMDLTWDGKLGIGVTDPASLLELRGGEIQLSASGVAHGMTTLYQTDVYGAIAYVSSGAGGLKLTGLSDTTSNGFLIEGIIGAASTTVAAIALSGYVKSEGGAGSLADSSALFQIQNGGDALLTMYGNGLVVTDQISLDTLLTKYVATGMELTRLMVDWVNDLDALTYLCEATDVLTIEAKRTSDAHVYSDTLTITASTTIEEFRAKIDGVIQNVDPSAYSYFDNQGYLHLDWSGVTNGSDYLHITSDNATTSAIIYAILLFGLMGAGQTYTSPRPVFGRYTPVVKDSDGIAVIATIETSETDLTLSPDENVVIASGKGLKLGNARQAGAPTCDGYVIIKDSTGTSYKIPCLAV